MQPVIGGGGGLTKRWGSENSIREGTRPPWHYATAPPEKKPTMRPCADPQCGVNHPWCSSQFCALRRKTRVRNFGHQRPVSGGLSPSRPHDCQKGLEVL